MILILSLSIFAKEIKQDRLTLSTEEKRMTLVTANTPIQAVAQLLEHTLDVKIKVEKSLKASFTLDIDGEFSAKEIWGIIQKELHKNRISYKYEAGTIRLFRQAENGK
jgi:hypothetical protein